MKLNFGASALFVVVATLFLGLEAFAARHSGRDLVFKLPVIANAPNLVEKKKTDMDMSAPLLLSLKDFQGKLLYVDFWDSYCLPCRDSFPELNRLRQEFGRFGFEVVGISVDANPKDALRFVQEHNVEFPILNDPSGTSAIVNGVEALPTGFLIGPDGVILKVLTPFQTKQIYDILQPVLVSRIPLGLAEED